MKHTNSDTIKNITSSITPDYINILRVVRHIKHLVHNMHHIDSRPSGPVEPPTCTVVTFNISPRTTRRTSDAINDSITITTSSSANPLCQKLSLVIVIPVRTWFYVIPEMFVLLLIHRVICPSAVTCPCTGSSHVDHTKLDPMSTK